jgi:hypothetical protein
MGVVLLLILGWLTRLSAFALLDHVLFVDSGRNLTTVAAPFQTLSTAVHYSDLQAGQSCSALSQLAAVNKNWIPILRATGPFNHTGGKQAVMYQCRGGIQVNEWLAPWWPGAAEAVAGFYRSFAQQLLQNPDRSYVTRLVLSLGPDDEWRYPADHNFCWFSDDAHQSFRRWLQDKYQEDLVALQQSWESDVPFATWSDVGVLEAYNDGNYLRDVQDWYGYVLLAWGLTHFDAASAELAVLGVPIIVKLPSVPFRSVQFGSVAGYGLGKSVAGNNRPLGSANDYRAAFKPFLQSIRAARARGLNLELWLPNIDTEDAFEFEQWSYAAEFATRTNVNADEEPVPLWTGCRHFDVCMYPNRWPEWQRRLRAAHVSGFFSHVEFASAAAQHLEPLVESLQSGFMPRRRQPIVVWLPDPQGLWPAVWARGGPHPPSSNKVGGSIPIQLFVPKNINVDRFFLDQYQQQFHLRWDMEQWLPLYTLQQPQLTGFSSPGLNVTSTVVHALSLLVDCEQLDGGKFYLQFRSSPQDMSVAHQPVFEILCDKLHVVDWPARENAVFDLPL